MCVCIYAHVSAYRYLNLYVYTYEYTQSESDRGECMECVYEYVYIGTHINTYMCTCKHMDMFNPKVSLVRALIVCMSRITCLQNV